MAYILTFIGILLIVTGAKDTYKALGAQLYKDFIGSQGFVYWLIAVGIIGAVGYYAPWRKFSRLFLALIIIVYILRNGGLFSQLQSALGQGPQEPASNAPPLPQDIPLHLSGLGGTPIPIKIQQGAGMTTLQNGQQGITALFSQGGGAGGGQ